MRREEKRRGGVKKKCTAHPGGQERRKVGKGKKHGEGEGWIGQVDTR